MASNLKNKKESFFLSIVPKQEVPGSFKSIIFTYFSFRYTYYIDIFDPFVGKKSTRSFNIFTVQSASIFDNINASTDQDEKSANSI